MNKQMKQVLVICFGALFLYGCGAVSEKVVYRNDSQVQNAQFGAAYGWDSPQNISAINDDTKSQTYPIFGRMDVDSQRIYFARSTDIEGGAYCGFRLYWYDYSSGQSGQSGLEAINNWSLLNSYPKASVRPIGISKDGRIMYLRSDVEGWATNTNTEEIYTSTYSGGKWSTPIKITSIADGSNKELCVVFDPRDDYSMFIVKAPTVTELGGQIYVSKKIGAWASPQVDINDRMYALNSQSKNIYSVVIDWLDPNNKAYISCDPSSLGVENLGKQDIYEAYFSINNVWERGQNINSNYNNFPVNSSGDDIITSINRDGTLMALFSNRDNPTVKRYSIYIARRDLVQNLKK